jgi:hypothetical protein
MPVTFDDLVPSEGAQDTRERDLPGVPGTAVVGGSAEPQAGTQTSARVSFDDLVPGNGDQQDTGSTGDVALDAVTGFGYGFNEGLDATANLVGGLVRVPVNYAARQFGYEGDLIPELNAARQFSVAGRPDTAAGRVGEAVGEVTGSSVAPTGGLLAAGARGGRQAIPLLQQFGRNPGTAAALDTGAAVSAGAGVGAAREAETGPIGELGAGLVAGFAGPGAVNIGARRVQNVRDATEFARRQVRRAQDPERAAYQDVADDMVRTGVSPDAAQDVVLPRLSADLQRRGWNRERLGTMISRSLRGEPTEQLAREYGVAEETVRNYVRSYQRNNPTPLNLVDIAKLQVGEGRATPLARAARRDMAISDDAESAERLIQRQVGQPGRVADIAENATPGGATYDEALDTLEGEVRRQASRAYDRVRQSAQPINLRPVIQAWRSRFPGGRDQGELSEGVNRAIDTFFRGSLVQGDDGVMRQRRFADVVSDIPSFLARRQELDQQIARSYDGNRPTPLTRQLTQFRRDVNRAARRSNPELANADALFSGARTAERLLEQGVRVGKKMNARSRQMVRDFRNLTPDQQEIFRLGFIQQMTEDALNQRLGTSAARQFDTEAFGRLVNAFFPRSAGREVHQRGQTLLRQLRGESATSRTFNDVMSGSRTAPLQDDMQQVMESSRTVTKLVTGDIRGVLEDWGTWLARRIGEDAARERLRILTETDPARFPQMLNKLARSARSAEEREFWRNRIRDFARVGRRPSADIGATTATTEQ